MLVTRFDTFEISKNKATQLNRASSLSFSLPLLEKGLIKG
jgi:hypothetical protein